jgi:hypothetical protein
MIADSSSEPIILLSGRPYVPRKSRTQTRKPSRLLRIDDPFLAEDRLWLIDGLIEDRGSLLVVAEEGLGKSAFAVEGARAIATGSDFFGHSVEPGLVIYIAVEKFREAGRRLRAVLQHEARGRVRIMQQSPFNGEKGAIEEFIADAKAFEKDERDRLVLVVVDTAGRAIGERDENSTRDANAFLSALDIVRGKLGAAVLLVHHARRNEGRARGSQACPAWADGVLAIERTKTGRVAKLTKSNIVEEGVIIPFSIESKAVDPENEGAGNVAVAVQLRVSTDRRAAPSRALSGDALGAALALLALTPNDSPVSIEAWRKATVSRWNKGNSDASRVAWHSIVNPKKSRLLRDGYIAIEGGSVRPLAAVREALGSVSNEEALGVSSSPSPKGEREGAANATHAMPANAVLTP